MRARTVDFLRVMLTSDVLTGTALERATQASLLRFHLTHSKQENESYLAAVETNRVGKKIQEKAAGRKAAKGGVAATAEKGEADAGKKRKRDYRQREVVDVSQKLKRSEGDLNNVLGRLF